METGDMTYRPSLPFFAIAGTVYALLACDGAGATGPRRRGRRAAVPTTAVAPSASPSAGDCDPAGAVLHVGTGRVRPPPAMPEPAARRPFRDPVFGTCVRRLSDRAHDQTPAGEGTGIVPEYSRADPFNADGTRFLLQSTAGSWYLYDARTYRLVRKLEVQGSFEPRWHPSDPDVVFMMMDTSLVRYHVSDDRRETLHDFAPDFRAWRPVLVLSGGEGNLSDDGRYTALFVEEEGSYAVRGFFTYDVQASRILGRVDLGGRNQNLNNVSMSHTGQYVIAAYAGGGECPEGSLGTLERPCGLMAYSRDLTSARGIARSVGELDAALDAQGRDVVAYQSNERDTVAYADLATGRTVDVLALDFHASPHIGLHFSGRAFARPGWALVSAFVDVAQARPWWMDELVFWYELRPGGRVVPIAHHRSLRTQEGDDYFAEPHATTNRDATRVVFASNWGRSGSVELDAYEVRLPSDWPDHLR